MKEHHKHLLIVALTMLAAVSGTSLLGSARMSPTGYVVGVPGTCVPQMTLEFPEEVILAPGDTLSIDIPVTNVLCGYTHVRFFLDNFPSDWYSVSPDYIASISPFDSKNFVLIVDIPTNAGEKTYYAGARVLTNEKNYEKPGFEVTVKIPPKPEAKIEISPELETPTQTQPTLPQISASRQEITLQGSNIHRSENIKFWWIIFLSSIVAFVVFIANEFYVSKVRREKQAKDKSEEALESALDDKDDSLSDELDKKLEKKKKQR